MNVLRYGLIPALLIATLPVFGSDLSTRDSNAAGPNWIPQGTRFVIRLQNRVDSKNGRGKHFKAKLAEDLSAPNGAMIPRGAEIKGHISEATRGLHGKLLLSFDEIQTPHGWMPLAATVTDVPGEHGVKTDSQEGEIQRQGTDKTRVIKDAAIGAGTGAAAGAIFGGGKGAGIGAGAGAGLGAATGILRNGDLRLDKGQQLEVSLDRALEVPSH
ncbi:MAG TPA: hypothetical protein VKW78_14255 [Terriglobales bacterium]|nr:hypothetical protein [Terriglobales bacterium]